MLKNFSIGTETVVVDIAVNPMEYRLDFSGPAAIESLHAPFGSPIGPLSAEFAVDGDYTVTAGLYSDSGSLLGRAITVTFNVANAPVTKEVQAVATIDVS